MITTENLKTSTPVRAVVGASDLVMEKLRDARHDAQERLSHVNVAPKKWQEDAQRLQSDVQSAAHDLITQASSTYDELATRGKEILEGSEAQQRAATEAEAAASKSTPAKKAAKSTTAAKSSTSTAKKTAKKTTDTPDA